MSASSDHRLLIEQAKAGNREAFGRLFELYCRSFFDRSQWAIHGRKVSRRVRASDLVQEQFLEAWRDIATFRGSTLVEFNAWLRAIGDRTLLKAIRFHTQQKKRSLDREKALDRTSTSSGSTPLEPASPDESNPANKVIQAEESERLAESVGRALDKLPDRQREAVLLRHGDELSVPDIAVALGTSYGAAAGLIKRGMEKLRSLLESEKLE